MLFEGAAAAVTGPDGADETDTELFVDLVLADAAFELELTATAVAGPAVEEDDEADDGADEDDDDDAGVDEETHSVVKFEFVE